MYGYSHEFETNLYGLQFKKLENYVGFSMYGYSHEFGTKLYCLQIKRLVNKLVLVCINTHMNFKPSCMVCNSRNLFELETMLSKSITILGDPRRLLLVVWLWNEGYVVTIKNLFWNTMTKYMKSKEIEI